jgi:uncharacterized membrane protein (UPF0127 family)
MLLLGDYVKRNDKLHFLTPAGKAIPIRIANTFGSRFLGLMGKKKGEYGLLLIPCNSVHTFFMRYNLDAVFLDKNNKIISIKRLIKPFSLVPPVPKARKVLEFPSSIHATTYMNTEDQISFYSDQE